MQGNGRKGGGGGEGGGGTSVKSRVCGSDDEEPRSSWKFDGEVSTTDKQSHWAAERKQRDTMVEGNRTTQQLDSSHVWALEVSLKE